MKAASKQASTGKRGCTAPREERALAWQHAGRALRARRLVCPPRFPMAALPRARPHLERPPHARLLHCLPQRCRLKILIHLPAPLQDGGSTGRAASLRACSGAAQQPQASKSSASLPYCRPVPQVPSPSALLAAARLSGMQRGLGATSSALCPPPPHLWQHVALAAPAADEQHLHAARALHARLEPHGDGPARTGSRQLVGTCGPPSAAQPRSAGAGGRALQGPPARASPSTLHSPCHQALPAGAVLLVLAALARDQGRWAAEAVWHTGGCGGCCGGSCCWRCSGAPHRASQGSENQHPGLLRRGLGLLGPGGRALLVESRGGVPRCLQASGRPYKGLSDLITGCEARRARRGTRPGSAGLGFALQTAG